MKHFYTGEGILIESWEYEIDPTGEIAGEIMKELKNEPREDEITDPELLRDLQDIVY